MPKQASLRDSAQQVHFVEAGKASLDQTVFVKDETLQLLVEELFVLDLAQDQLCVSRVGRTHLFHSEHVQPLLVLLQVCFGKNAHALRHPLLLSTVDLCHAPCPRKEVETHVHCDQLCKRGIAEGQVAHVIKLVLTENALPISQGRVTPALLRIRRVSGLGW